MTGFANKLEVASHVPTDTASAIRPQGCGFGPVVAHASSVQFRFVPVAELGRSEAAKKDRKRRSGTPRLHCKGSDESVWLRTPSDCGNEKELGGNVQESDQSSNDRLRALSPLRVRVNREITQVKSELGDAAQAAESQPIGGASS